MTLFRLGLKPSFALFLACFIWGAATALNKELLGPISPIPLLIIQLLPGVGLFSLLTFCSGHRLPKGINLAKAAALGLINPGISYTLSMLGLERISASIASLMWATEPIMILILAGIVLAEPITRKLLIIVGLGLAGVALVVGVIGGSDTLGVDPIGVLLLAGAVLLCAIYTVFSRKVTISVDPIPLLAVQQSIGLIWAMGMLVLTSGGNAIPDMSAIPLVSVTLAAMTGFLYYGLSYWLYLYALRHLPAAVAGGYFNIIPLVTILLALVFLGERLATLQWGGAILIAISAILLFQETVRQEKLSSLA